MSKLSAIVKNRAEVTVEIPGADDGPPVPVTVAYRPRMNTLAFRERFAEQLGTLNRLMAAVQAAAGAGDAAEAERLAAAPELEQAADAMTKMTLGLIEGWDLEDEDEDGKAVAVPFPQTTDDIKAFPAPEMFQQVLKAVMERLNPNRTAGEPSTTDSPAT